MLRRFRLLILSFLFIGGTMCLAPNRSVSAVSRGRTQADARIIKGHAAFKAKKYREAERWFKLAVEVDKSYPLAWLWLGTTYARMKDYPAARTCFNTVLELAPANSQDAKDARRKLKDLPQPPRAEEEEPPPPTPYRVMLNSTEVFGAAPPQKRNGVMAIAMGAAMTQLGWEKDYDDVAHEIIWFRGGERIRLRAKNRSVAITDAQGGNERRVVLSQAPYEVKTANGDVLMVSLQFFKDVLKIDAGTNDALRTIYLTNIITGPPPTSTTPPPPSGTAILRGHLKPVRVLAWSRDGSKLASGSDDGMVQVWDVARSGNLDGRLAKAFSTALPVRALALSPNGDAVISGHDDGSVRLWSVDGDEGAQVLTRPNVGAVAALAWSNDGTSFVSSHIKPGTLKTGVVAVWNRARHTADYDRITLLSTSRALLFSPKGTLFLADGYAPLRGIDLNNAANSLSLTGDDRKPMQSLAISPEGKTLAGTDEDGIWHEWDLTASGTRLSERRIANGNAGWFAGSAVRSIAFASENRVLLVTAKGLVSLDRTTRKQTFLSSAAKTVYSVACADGVCAAGSEDAVHLLSGNAISNESN